MIDIVVAGGATAYVVEMVRLAIPQERRAVVAPGDGGKKIDPSEPGFPLVSFLVPAWNAAGDIERFIREFKALSLPCKELVMCVGGSDEGLAIAQSHAGNGVVVLPQLAGEGKQRALQRSFAICRGDIVYLTDVDCEIKDDSVYALLRPVICQNAEVVTGEAAPWTTQMDAPLVRAFAAAESATAPTRVQPTLGLRGCNSAVTRRALDKIQGFEVEAPSGTDYTLAQELRRAGFTIWFVPGCPVRTRYATSTMGYIRQQRRWTRNVYVLGRRYGVQADVKGALKTFALASFTAGLFIAGFGFWPAWIMAFLLLTHATVNQIRYQKAAGYRPTIFGGMQAFLANQVAAICAMTDVVTGRAPW